MAKDIALSPFCFWGKCCAQSLLSATYWKHAKIKPSAV